jgi:hypothetical protein
MKKDKERRVKGAILRKMSVKIKGFLSGVGIGVFSVKVGICTIRFIDQNVDLLNV